MLPMLEILDARLPRAEYLALAADLEVLFGDLKSVGGLLPLCRGVPWRRPSFCNPVSSTQ